MSDEAKVKSLAKALSVLNCFKDGNMHGVSEISEIMGLSKSNISDILSTFRDFGYLSQDSDTSRYRLGYAFLDMAHVVATSIGFHRTIYPFMKQLSDDVKETVYFAIPDGKEVLYLDAAYPLHEYATRTMLGDRAWMYCTGLGKAILSQYPDNELAAHCPSPLISFTPNTMTSLEVLQKDLDEIRKRGYAVDNMEHEFGIKCVAVPIVDAHQNPIAAISVSGPSLRFDETTIPQIGARLMNLVPQISLLVNNIRFH